MVLRAIGEKVAIVILLFSLLILSPGIVLSACNADFHANHTSGCSPMAVVFTDDSEDAISWNWTFSGGSPASATGRGPHTVYYYTAGMFNVVLNITCAGGLKDSESKRAYISVENCGCFPDLLAEPRSGCAPLTVVFQDFSSLATSWSWSFPGGTPSSATGVGPHEVTYEFPGVYDVSLSITCPQGVGTQIKIKNRFISVDDCGGFDFGDAPDPGYPTLSASGGASHVINTGFYLGSIIDSESNGQPNDFATGDDDAFLDDEDGVLLPISFFIGSSASLQITTSDTGFVNGWIDFNTNGDWGDANEHFINDQIICGTENVTFSIPHDAHPGHTFMRFRLCKSPGLSYTGSAPDGEVEDYRILLSRMDNYDYGDAPDDFDILGYPTLTLHSGAHHFINPLFFLGDTIDSEIDGQPSDNSFGDDFSSLDDEDGVIMPVGLQRGVTTLITTIVNGAGTSYLNAWIDLNRDRDWLDANEHFIVDELFFNGISSSSPIREEFVTSLTVPLDATPGHTFIRFRYSTQSGLTPDGPAPDGEVEDYLAVITPSPPLRLKWMQPPMVNPDSPAPDCFWGWDEPSIFSYIIVADDWRCTDDQPVTDVHWWGSYLGWNESTPPASGPQRFKLGIWTDVKAGVDREFSHPGTLIWQWVAARSELNERYAGCDYYPQMMDMSETCFQYDLILPEAAWFYQEGDTTIYWLSIAADYDVIPNGGKWGWKTRPHYFNDFAVLSDDPASPEVGSVWNNGQPVSLNWDMAFALTTEIAETQYDYGDAPDPSYPTLDVNNGAHHVVIPGFHIGWLNDTDSDGQPLPHADGDDNDGMNDDDAVSFATELQPGQDAVVYIRASAAGYLNAWIDYNSNGTWTDPGEQVFIGQELTAGINILTYSVPDDALPGATFVRLRFSSIRNLTCDGYAPDGEVEDYEIVIGEVREPEFDLGDAPDNSNDFGMDMTAYPAGGPAGTVASYPTVYLHNSPPFGPLHKDPLAASGLGVAVTMENEADIGYDDDPFNNIDPLNDKPDQDGADDAVTIPLFLSNCGLCSFQYVVNVYHNILRGMFVNVWFDWNRDGDWNDTVECPGGPVPEWAVQNHFLTFSSLGLHLFTTPIFVAWQPDAAIAPPIWMRISLAERSWSPFLDGVETTGGAGPRNGYGYGETEDYYFVPLTNEEQYDYGDAPDPHYPTLEASCAARHTIVPGIFLGANIDPELDGQPDNAASGDDANGLDDEDGVTFSPPLVAGEETHIYVTVPNHGNLFAWIDYNCDGDWADADEQIFDEKPLVPGVNDLVITIPASALPEPTYARFRFGHLNGLSIAGSATNGEVEDYLIRITRRSEGEPGPFKWSQPPLKKIDSLHPECWWGWSERSDFQFKLVADDWFCKDERPLTGVQWWGSYADWDTTIAPPNAPRRFHIGIWTDVAAGIDTLFSHPGKLLKEWVVNRSSLHEHVDCCDFITDSLDIPDSTFSYTFNIADPTDWFLQEPDSTIFWISISAIYDTPPDSCEWGWKSRQHYFNDDAVSIYEPLAPDVDDRYRSGGPVRYLWDMAFELFTNEPGYEYDFGDAPEPDFATVFADNGAHHIINPGVFLGYRIDADADGQPEENAQGDDMDGVYDEDGVSLITALVANQTAKVQVRASIAGLLNAWIDFDSNGDWDGPEEQIFTDAPLTPGVNVLDFHVPAVVVSDSNYARFRFSTLSPRSFTGLAIDGEVEDYRMTVIETAVPVDGENGLPRSFALRQNYPNPFNPSTMIEYDLPRAENVKLIIFDILGRQVRTLVDDKQIPGSYKLRWDGLDDRGYRAASGVYIYYIQAGSFRQAKKLLLLK